ncbi:MAG: hypothetical protein IT492_08535 [Gammaproteobacteria bacterium]|nr:hypothetical protein [Gammaproteobacteria bacterium]
MDLRIRLTLLLALVFGATLAVAIGFLLADVRQAVLDELNASSDLAITLLHGIVDMSDAAGSESRLTKLAGRLTHDAAIRHLRFEVTNNAQAAATASVVLRSPKNGAPDWFATLARPDPTQLVHAVPYKHGRIMVVADPDDEVAEAWRETKTTMALLFALCAGAVGMVYIFLGRALRPLGELALALEGIERGKFAARVPLIGLTDIDAITARYNHMASALAQSHAENAQLAQRSLKIQEQERRYLAHELHDEMGQSISAIKALAVSIRERLEGSDASLAERADTICDVSSDIYARVRRMMARLHPVVLDELGLIAAVETMVDEWNTHHEDCFCGFDASRDLPPLTALALISVYRIAQEGLTNIARHAEANEASIEIKLGTDEQGASILTLEVSDNGRGVDPACLRQGLGLMGMQERTEALGGHLQIDSSPGHGLRVLVRLPLTMLIETVRLTD